MLERAVTLYQVVASDCDASFDDLWTILSDDFVYHCESESSDNGEHCERRFFQEECLEIHKRRRLAAREYDHFAVWLNENQGHQDLLDSFCVFLQHKYDARFYPSLPVKHSYERYIPCRFLSFPPCDSGKDSSSSDLVSSVLPAELPEGGAQAVGLSQGDSGVPSAFVLLAGHVASALA